MTAILNDPAKLATPSQVSYLKDLTRDRLVPEQHAGRLAQLLSSHEIGTKHLERQLASDTIAWLLKLPMRSVTENPVVKAPLVMGVYQHDEQLFVIKPRKDKTRLYAMRVEQSAPRLTEKGEVVDFELVFAPGMMKVLTPDERLTMLQAENLLIRFERCINCHRHLKAAKSVAEGIGPVCSAKMFA